MTSCYRWCLRRWESRLAVRAVDKGDVAGWLPGDSEASRGEGAAGATRPSQKR